MQDTDRRAVKMGMGAVMLWSTVATAFSLSLEYLTPLQLVTLATIVSWCFLLSPLVCSRFLGLGFLACWSWLLAKGTKGS